MNKKYNALQTRRTPFSGMLFAILMLFGISQTAFAQVTTNSGSGLAPTYASLNLAITALNATTITAPVIITLTANEIAPVGGYSITAQGTATNTIIIQGFVSAGTITASPALVVGVVTDAIFKLIGADFVTIQNFTMQENAVNTISATAASNNMTEWGVALLYASTTNGAQNNTIQNNTISLNRAYSNTFGIYSNVRHTPTAPTVIADITAPTGANSNNKAYTNAINNVNYGVVFIGTILAVNMDSGNDIGGTTATTGNTLTNWGGGAPLTPYVSINVNTIGIHTAHQLGINTSFNTLISANITSTTTSAFGILNSYPSAQPAGSFTLNITNNTITISLNGISTNIAGISNANITIPLAGVTANLSNNIIQNCVISGVGASGFISCMINISAVGVLQMNNNIIRGNTSTATTGGFNGVSLAGNAVVTTSSISNNQIGTATSPAITFSAATTGLITSIRHVAAANTATVTITGNDIRGIVQSVAGSGAHDYINCNGGTPLALTVSNNTFTNITANTTGTVTFVAHNYSMPANGTQTFNNNSIVTGFNKTGAGGVITGIAAGGNSSSNSTSTITNNNFSNITVTGATDIIGINNADGNVGGSPNRIITGNIFNNWNGSVGAYTGISFFNIGISSNINNNIITNHNTVGSITGLVISNFSAAGNPLTISNNTISGLVSTGIGNVVTGLFANNGSPTINITGNSITGILSAGASYGMFISMGTVVNISKNKIGDISNSLANGITEGISITGGTTINVTNNLIGDLRASAANSTIDAVRGITVALGTALSNVNVYFNTISIGGTSFGANFSSAAIFHQTNTTTTTGTLDMRNNIFVNSGVATGTGNCVAYRRSSTAFNNFATTSNRNSFFAPIIFADGTNTDATLAAYQTRVGGTIDANSIFTSPVFVSTSIASALFLRINATSLSLLESAGANVGITDDVDGDVRQGNAGYTGNGTAPDIGADEFASVVFVCSTITLTLAPAVASAGTLVSGTVGTSYSQQFTGTGVAGTYTYAISFSTAALPAGLSFSTTTGLLSGTPTVATSVVFSVTASVGGCTNAPVNYTLVINSNPATSVDNSLANLVKVSPNPSSNDFNVDFGSINMVKSSVCVYDAQGKTVFTADNNSNLMTISLDKFAAGIYLLEVETSKGRILKRLAKQ